MDGSFKNMFDRLYPDEAAETRSKRLASLASRRRRGIVFGYLALITSSVLLLVYYWNLFVTLDQNVKSAKAQIETHLERRQNIVLALRVLVGNYARHEKEIFHYAAATRKEMVETKPSLVKGGPAVAPKKPTAGGRPDDVEGLLTRAFAFAERYPELHASETCQRFMDALVDTENRIAERRLEYNNCQSIMAIACGKFPGIVLAWIYGFTIPPAFEARPNAAGLPKVE